MGGWRDFALRGCFSREAMGLGLSKASNEFLEAVFGFV
jgi:hypothetical protein